MTSAAEQATTEFMANAGVHNTTVHEVVAPAVLHEKINRTQHENVQTVIKKDIHQDHYHTSVQPITDREVLPEKHTHNLVAIEKREIEHGDSEDVKARLAAEAAKFTDERVVGEIEHTHSVAPIIQGESIHHHVHETIQPVVMREVIEPTVVHTTVPIHETHHNAAQHHSTSALPAVSMADFKKQGGVLTGREERFDGFEGEPRSVGGALSGATESYESTGKSGVTGSSHSYTQSSHSQTGSSTTGKPSMKDKLNPKIDADGDGKAGFMS